jgi:hypothetical protein
MKAFAEMSQIDVSAHVEKKGKFSYLSWPFAVAEFRKNCPSGVWAVTKCNGSPVMTTPQGNFVEVAVTPDSAQPELTFTQIHPILDSNNKPIQSPNSFQVNTSIQRCIVKAIAIATGIGLYIYAGEDLPDQADNGSGNNAHKTKSEDKKNQPPVPEITPDQEIMVLDWIGQCDKAHNKDDKDVLRTWFAANRDAMHKDCGMVGENKIISYCESLVNECNPK